MPTCFVIQPFDSDRFDKRFDEIYGPALEQAGLEPYRVDRDPAVEVTIDSIHDGIRAAAMCLADITTDNPNVWYELGFALALDRDVILICSDERGTKYPFDIQHRNIIQYGTGSRGDYDTLHRSISERAQALLEKEPRSRRETERDALQGTLSESEIAVLIVAAENIAVPGERLLANALKGNVERSGLNRGRLRSSDLQAATERLLEGCSG